MACIAKTGVQKKIMAAGSTMGARSGTAAAECEQQLFTWPCAQLSLVHGDERALLQKGAFTLMLARHSRSAYLLVVEASVGNVRWPVGKDCLVGSFAAHPSCFLFALRLPASRDHLTYQLQLLFDDHADVSPSSCIFQIRRLQALLTLYATVHLQDPTNPGPAESGLKELEKAAGKYWTSRGGDKQEIGKQEADTCKNEREKESDQSSAMDTDSQSSHGSSPTASSTASPAGVSKRMMKRMQKARQISAISKLFSKAVVRGLISSKAHVVHEAVGSRNSEQTSSTDNIKGDGISKPAVANVDVITQVVEAVEGSLPRGKKASSSASAMPDRGCEAVLDISAMATWTINELGLRLVLNTAMAASNMQAGRGRAAAAASSAASSRLTSLDSNAMSTCAAPMRAKTVAAPSRSSSDHSSFQNNSASSCLTASPSRHGRPPRPPRPADALLSEVSSPVLVNAKPTGV